jgi:hypothetical protein
VRFFSIIILAILAAVDTSGQRVVRGEVRLKTDSTFLPAVNVVEKGGMNAVVADRGGKFEINCSSSKPVLQFSFIGLKTIEITVQEDYLFVYLEEDKELLKEKTRFGMYPEYTSIGLSSGLMYTPYGINIRNAIPVLFGLKMLTTTAITYRTDLNKNEFLDVRIKREKLINTMYYGRYFNVEFDYAKRAIQKGNEHWNMQELNITSELILDDVLIRLGYGRQSFNDTETLKSNHGLIFGVGGRLKNYIQVVATAKKWNNYWQLETRFLKGFSGNNFEIGLCAETVKGYKEIQLLLIYRIHY